jgi:hypothetical protein
MRRVHHHDERAPSVLLDGGQCFEAVQPRHLPVQDDHVGLQQLSGCYRFLSISRLADDFIAGVKVKDEPKNGAHVRYVVDDEHSCSAPHGRFGRRRPYGVPSRWMLSVKSMTVCLHTKASAPAATAAESWIGSWE